MLADGLGVSPAVQGRLAYLLERWDGHGPLGRAKGEQIPAADADRPACGRCGLPAHARR